MPCVENGFLSTKMPIELENITVQNLMIPGENKWDEEVMNDICNDRDVDLIKRILLFANGGHDSWFWILNFKCP